MPACCSKSAYSLPTLLPRLAPPLLPGAGRVYQETMLATTCTAKPDFTACGWAAKDGFPADSAMGMSRSIGGWGMHPVRASPQQHDTLRGMSALIDWCFG